MNKLPLICIALLLSFSASAFESVPVDAVVCNPTKSVESWTFVRSYNTYNGIPDKQGYLEIKFAKALTKNNTIAQTTIRLAIKNLKWDSKFKNVIFTSTEGDLTTCARKNIFGLKLYKEECFLDLVSLEELSDGRLNQCDNLIGAYFTGQLVIK